MSNRNCGDFYISSPSLVPFHIDPNESKDAAKYNKTPPMNEQDCDQFDDSTSSLLVTAETNKVYTPKPMGPTFITVAGGRGSGKKELCELIVTNLEQIHTQKHHQQSKRVNDNPLETERLIKTQPPQQPLSRLLVLKLDDFRRELTDYERELNNKGYALNLDHPDAYDFKLLENVMYKLSQGNEVEIPAWDSDTMTRTMGRKITQMPQVIIVEGIFTLYNRNVRRFFDMKIFVDVDADTRLGRNVKTLVTEFQNQQQPDSNTNDHNVHSAKRIDLYLKNYLLLEKPVFEEFILPSKRWADIIIPRGDENEVAIKLLMNHISDMVSISRAESALTLSSSMSSFSLN
ncbi:UMP-CMP kinase [Mycoemilia scoparia]|uniref:UMP-CMP kinase n=1 Tax=Mycoemilia scoparia TaxID=417184 RepID=A0A9W7ZTN7_9FUNG|nr:UMP-CMP kinase [Mycoemilia scoparia]